MKFFECMYSMRLICNENRKYKTTIQQFCLNIATYCRLGGNLRNMYIENFLTNLLVKEFWKSAHICQSNYQTSRGLVFFGTRCINDDANRLIGKKKNSLEAKTARAEVEQIFQTWTEEFHHHDVVVALRAAPFYQRYPDCNSSTNTSISNTVECPCNKTASDFYMVSQKKLDPL